MLSLVVEFTRFVIWCNFQQIQEPKITVTYNRLVRRRRILLIAYLLKLIIDLQNCYLTYKKLQTLISLTSQLRNLPNMTYRTYKILNSNLSDLQQPDLLA